jgi:hypothetical protein
MTAAIEVRRNQLPDGGIRMPRGVNQPLLNAVGVAMRVSLSDVPYSEAHVVEEMYRAMREYLADIRLRPGPWVRLAPVLYDDVAQAGVAAFRAALNERTALDLRNVKQVYEALYDHLAARQDDHKTK